MTKNIKISRFALLVSACIINSWSQLSYANNAINTSKSYYLDTSNYERNYITGTNNKEHNSKGLYLKLGLGNSKKSKPKGYFKRHIGNCSSLNIGLGGNFISNNRLELNFIKHNGSKYSEEQSIPLQLKSISAAIKSETVMLNFYSDHLITKIFNPYFGFGVGYTKNRVNFNRSTTIEHLTRLRNHSASKNGIAWQAVLGINLPVHNKLSFDLSYRYSHLGRFPDMPNYISLDNKKIQGSKLKMQEILFSILVKI